MESQTNDLLNNILIRGAKEHNLQNISLRIPKNQLIVISGVSGSGKSSLAFDTLFAEGQRRYIESLSSYARQFLGKLQKPNVDEIIGICPAIAIEQKVISHHSRSTVGTSTEIFDYMRLLFARIGKTYSPVSGKQVKKDTVEDVVDFILQQPNNSSCLILTNYKNNGKQDILSVLLQQGFSRIRIDGEIIKIHQNTEQINLVQNQEEVCVVIDRIIVDNGEDTKNRITDSVKTAFYEGHGECTIEINSKEFYFSNRFEKDGITFVEPTVHLFSFNNPFGACKVCEGFGDMLGIDEDKVVPNKYLSIYQGAITCWHGEKLGKWLERFILYASDYEFPVHRPYNELNQIEKDILWNGKGKCKGIYDFFQSLEEDKYKIQNRVLIARFRGKTKCTACHGTRLRKDAEYVKINERSFAEVAALSIERSLVFFKNLSLSVQDQKIAERLLTEIINRLAFLLDVGLGYLTLSRASNTLSGGESQRINLATSLGSSLVGSMYILDEPSIGLHPNDTQKLIKVLKQLRDLKNTVIVVEHDEEIMEQADQLIDLGPLAGKLGGELVFQGRIQDFSKDTKSLTGKYLNGGLSIPIPKNRRTWKDAIAIKGIFHHNLKNVSVEIPLQCFTVVSGVSGSGKTTLVKDVLYPELSNLLGVSGKKTGRCESVKVSTNQLRMVEFVDQNPIGQSSRSNPVTYIKAFDDIRNLFAHQPLAKNRNYSSSHFSFNVDGGRCEHCRGDGEIRVEMQFMADVHLICEDCKGKRYKDEILDVQFQNKNISDILHLSVDEAIDFFLKNEEKRIASKLLPLQQVGLGYVALGQSSSTLSGGEAQRIKLASFLGKGDLQEKILFIFDEPTTGLHFHDIHQLLNSFYALLDNGHSILCIEHNLDVIKCADWLIDLGPEGGERGGQIMFAGTPEDMIRSNQSLTAKYLSKKFA